MNTLDEIVADWADDAAFLSPRPLECAEPGCLTTLDPSTNFDCEEHFPNDFRCQPCFARHMDSEVYHPSG
jgi:hypothetical protein